MTKSIADKRTCYGCGHDFRPRLDGEFCPTCVGVLVAEGLTKDDFEQYRLLEEYGTVAGDG